MIILTIVNCVALWLLAILHFYWAFGGKWGFETALPTNDQGKRVLNPRAIDSIVVGMGLTAFGCIHLLSAGLIVLNALGWFANHGLWIVGGVFFLRAVGDFRYVGFFKRVKGTNFSRADSVYYSPLCFGIAVIAIILVVTL